MPRNPLRILLPVPPDLRVARVAVLVVGLWLYGASMGLMLLAALGLAPWGVLDQGLAVTLGGSVGTWSIVMGAVVLLLWIPLRQRPGIGTLLNVVLVGTAIDVTLATVPTPTAMWTRVCVLVAGIVLNALATGLYVGAGLGPGPRDGLMTGLAERGYPVRVVRTAIEVVVLAAGWLLGGDVGWGTLAYAATIGLLLHVLLPALRLRTSGPGAAVVGHDAVVHEEQRDHTREIAVGGVGYARDAR